MTESLTREHTPTDQDPSGDRPVAGPDVAVSIGEVAAGATVRVTRTTVEVFDAVVVDPASLSAAARAELEESGGAWVRLDDWAPASLGAPGAVVRVHASPVIEGVGAQVVQVCDEVTVREDPPSPADRIPVAARPYRAPRPPMKKTKGSW